MLECLKPVVYESQGNREELIGAETDLISIGCIQEE